jgi:antitoxin component of MazEF toxin-antitoxin module
MGDDEEYNVNMFEMVRSIAPWGNSLALRIPAVLAREMGWEEGTEIELSVLEDGAVQLQRCDMSE